METQEIERILKEALNLDEVYVQGENAHYGVIAVSDQFAGLSKVKQQQMIYAPLLMQNLVNALRTVNTVHSQFISKQEQMYMDLFLKN